MKGTPKLPDADGKIDVTPNEEQALSTMKLDLEHLAPVPRLVDHDEGELGAAVVEEVAQARACRRLVVGDEDPGDARVGEGHRGVVM